jgi:hypothetical protein
MTGHLIDSKDVLCSLFKVCLDEGFFGGRILTNDKKAAKYLNSDIYHKVKVLYGFTRNKLLPNK